MITTERLERMDADIAELTATLRQRREQYLAELDKELKIERDLTRYQLLCKRAADLRGDLFDMDLAQAR